MKTFIFKFTSLDHISEDGSMKLDYIVGETIASAMLTNESPLELVRLKYKGQSIIARKRFNDVKLVITEENEYPIRKIQDMYENTTRNIS